MKTTLLKTGRSIHILESTQKLQSADRQTQTGFWLFLFLMGGFFLSNNSLAQVSTTGLKNPSTNTGATSGVNPANVYSSNDVYATFDASGETARFGGFAFGLSGNITVLGIGLRVEGNGDDTTDRDLNFSLSWNNGTTFTAVKTMPRQYASDGFSVMGGLGDTWGRTWTAAELSDATFSVRCVVPAAALSTLSIDHIQVVVYYATNNASIFSATGSFSVPAGVTNVTAEVWGAGAGGSSGTAAAGAGGGGAYTRGTISGLATGNSVAITVGTGGAIGLPITAPGNFSSAGFGATTITANGGLATTSSRTGGAGGTASAVGGAIAASFAGGAGGNGRVSTLNTNNESGGGGGGSALTTGAGTAGVTGTGDNNDLTVGGAGTGYGGGGAAGDGSPNAVAGSFPGGGGGGRGEGSSTSAAGSNGIVILTWCPTYSLTSTSAASPICISSPTSLVTVTGPAANLPVGTYNVTYNRSNPVGTGLAATLTVTTAGAGTFTATGLNVAGNSTITVTNIASTTISCSNAISSGNLSNTITITGLPTANAGSAVSVCYTSGAININPDATATAANAAAILWTGGAGTWTDAATLTPTYTPTAGEVSAGSVLVTLNVTGNTPCGNTSANKTIAIGTQPTVITSGSQTTCSTPPAAISASFTGTGITTTTWTTSGTGTFGNAASASTAYTASPADKLLGTVTLTMTTNDPIGPCVAASNTLILIYEPEATVSAGGDQAVCSTLPVVVSLTGTRGGSAISSTWSGGAGTFADASALSTTYTPSAGELASGGNINLTLTTNDPAGLCGAVSDFMVLTINVEAVASAGVDIDYCTSTTSVSLDGNRSGTGVTSSTWTTSGTGTFGNAGNTDTTYTPSAADKLLPSVTLTLTTIDPAGPCPSDADSMVLTIFPAAAISAGADQAACSTQPITLAGTMGGGASSVTWSAPTGSFSDVNSLTSTYTPSIASGTVVLTLTSNDPTGPCGALSDQKTVTVSPVPSTAGVTICQGQLSEELTSSTICPDGTPVSNGPNSATTAISVPIGSNLDWSNPTNIIAAGSPYATVALGAGANSDNLQATNYGFAIPANATIRGIQVAINRFGTQSLSLGYRDQTLYAVKNNVILTTATNKASNTTWPTGATVANYGANNDLWGASWTPAEINAANFGIALSVHSNAVFSTLTASVDYIRVTVTYTLPGDIKWYTAASGGSLVGSGSSLDPVGAPNSPLTNTNTPGEYEFYAECSAIGCRTKATFKINPLPVVNFTALDPVYCASAAPVELVANHSGGTFTGSGVVDHNNGTATFTPANAVAGPVAITYSYSDTQIPSCTNTTTQNITVNPNPTLASISQVAVCENTLATLNLTGLLAGSTSDITYTINNGSPVIVSVVSNGSGNGSFTVNLSLANNGQELKITNIHRTDLAFTCDTAPTVNNTLSLQVNPSPTLASISQAAVVCENTSATVNLTGLLVGSTSNITYTVNSGSPVVANGVVADGSGNGSFTVSLSLANNGQELKITNIHRTDLAVTCDTVPTTGNTLSLQVNPSPTLASTSQAAIVCENAAATINLTGLVATSTSDITYTIANGLPAVANGVLADASGNGSFSVIVSLANNGQQLKITNIHRTDLAVTCDTAPTSGNTVNLQVNLNVTYYADLDGDAFGDPNNALVSCFGPQGIHTLIDNSDCNDALLLYFDGDGDGFGSDTFVACPSATAVTNTDDCNDAEVLYTDADGDGFGSDIFAACASASTVTNTNDCNDNEVRYLDNDGDGFGRALNAQMIACGGSLVATDCDDAKASVYPGAFEVGYNLTDDDCDGLIDEGFPPKVTTIQGAFCNTTLPTIDSYIYANLVAGAQGYRWKVTKMNGAVPAVPLQEQFINTNLRVLRLTQLPIYAFDTQYRVEVSVIYAGFAQPFTPSTCIVSTPAATSKLIACGQTLTQMSNVIYAELVPFATGYRFEVTDTTDPLNTQTLDRSLREIRMNLITDFQVKYGRTYSIRVSVRNTDGSYMPFGTACNVTTPLFPTVGLQDSQCNDYIVPNYSTQIFAHSYPGAIQYVFKLVGLGLPSGGAEVSKNLRVVTLGEFPTLVPGATYNMQVKLVFSEDDIAGVFGKVCTVVAPGLSRQIQPAKATFNAVAYPNPFAEHFSIEVTTAMDSDITVKVYDMTGRLLESRAVKVSDVKSVVIGDGYPSGVYNVIVGQGDETKTLRMIKR
jgi:hypothetical protein